MGPFPVSCGYTYILVAVDYVSKWVEANATRCDYAKTVINFLRTNLFCRYGVPKAIISDQGTHFCNRMMASTLKHYHVHHRTSTVYHPQSHGSSGDLQPRNQEYSREDGEAGKERLESKAG
ncbi:unnamed protein product [Rhodiola kirilowii]